MSSTFHQQALFIHVSNIGYIGYMIIHVSNIGFIGYMIIHVSNIGYICVVLFSSRLCLSMWATLFVILQT